MRKPPNLTSQSQFFQATFNEGTFLDKNVKLTASNKSFDAEFEQVQHTAPTVQADWAQEDKTAPSYVKNKHIAEQYRPVTVNGEEFLDADRETGSLNVEGIDGIELSQDGNTLKISAQPVIDEINNTVAVSLLAGPGLIIEEGWSTDKGRQRTIGIDAETVFIIDCN